MKDLANYPGLERPKGRYFRVRVRLPRALIDAVYQNSDKWRSLLEADKRTHRRLVQLTGKGGKLREVVTKSLDTSNRHDAVKCYHIVMGEYRHLFDFATRSLTSPDKQPSDADIGWLARRYFSEQDRISADQFINTDFSHVAAEEIRSDILSAIADANKDDPETVSRYDAEAVALLTAEGYLRPEVNAVTNVQHMAFAPLEIAD
jgi:hypothetical protein